MNVSLVDVSTYLPGDPIGADYYAQFAESDDLRDNMMFRAPKFRHHVAEDETAIDMVERAAEGLIKRHGDDAIANVDVLITHTQMPDMPFYGGGGGMAHRLGHETQVGAGPAQRRMRRVRSRVEAGPKPTGVGRRTDRVDCRRAERSRADFRSADGTTKGSGLGTR